ncbi:MAG TPA: 5-oxoprolinase subunit PxpA [Thermoanaerobaculia bacterium]|nr:5-oxoprolinase subunit PxpA [Thermoanaerobaculia bacterium]
MIDLSADLGEGTPGEEAIWPLINAANVACGGHYGDEATMAAAAELASRYGVRLGAHPSYPDREHFGRRSMNMSDEALTESVAGQIAALQAIADIQHVKPHGALYNDAHHDSTVARAIIDAIRRVDPRLAVVCSTRSQLAAIARQHELMVIGEAFADRRYESDGTLTPRSLDGALLSVAEAAKQAERLARERSVIARDGSVVLVEFLTICIHADMESAAERLLAIRKRLA